MLIPWVCRQITRRNLCRETDNMTATHRMSIARNILCKIPYDAECMRCPRVTIRLLQDAFQIGVDDKRNSFPPVVIAKTTCRRRSVVRSRSFLDSNPYTVGLQLIAWTKIMQTSAKQNYFFIFNIKTSFLLFTYCILIDRKNIFCAPFCSVASLRLRKIFYSCKLAHVVISKILHVQ